MKTLLLIAGAASLSMSAASGLLSENQYQFLFTNYVTSHDKKYEMKDYFKRYDVFKKNLEYIISHNAKPNITHTLAINKFADFTAEEFSSQLTLKLFGAGVRQLAAQNNNHMRLLGAGTLPDKVDWTSEKNAHGVPVVGPVENQERCGSCWAFSTLGAVESSYVINGGTEYKKLSEQQLVDCAGGKYGNSGCNGGLMDLAMDYLKDHGGVLLKDYAYTGKDGQCKFTSTSRVAIPGDKFSYTPIASDKVGTNLKAAVAKGPVAVALAASSQAFQFYSSGVITDSTCKSTSPVNHAVLLTGYDKLNGIEYFNIRNSWGDSWGDKGYVKIATKDDTCGLTGHDFNVLPTVTAN